MNSNLRTAISVGSFLFLVHCGGSNSEPPKQPGEAVETTETTTETTTPSTTPQEGTTPSGTTTEQGQGPSSMNSGSMNSGSMNGSRANTGPVGTTTTTAGESTRGEALSDGQIVAITSAANEGEIAMAELAKKNADSARVKSFATTMISEHGNAEAKGKSISQNANIQPVESDISRRLKSDADGTLASLRGQKGKAFDKAYVNAQIKMHRQVLATIDDELLPNASNPQLKKHLDDVRKHVASHLAKAEDLEKKVDVP